MLRGAALKTAEIVSIGTELLMGQIVDSNAQYLGQTLPSVGIAHLHRQTVGDNRGRIVEALKLALSRADIVFTIGGLGPTDDDITRAAIADALDDVLVVDPDYVVTLRELFALRKISWTAKQDRQASHPSCGQLIANPNGTAPGIRCEKNGRVLISLPGPPGEFRPMIEALKPYLTELGGGDILVSRLLRVIGMGESAVETALGSIVDGSNPTVAPYAKLGEVHLRVTALAQSAAEANTLIDPVEAQIRAILGTHVYGTDATSIEATIVALLAARKQSLAVAESMTGGGLGQRLTSVSGSSAVFLGGVIAYTADVKQALLGVAAETLATFGPVSAETAREMALGIQQRLGSDFALSVTGNAGPNVDSDGKPVGLGYIGFTTPDGVHVEPFQFKSLREDNRYRAGQMALAILYRHLAG